VRKRLIIVGYSREALELVPLLETNPEVFIAAFVSRDPAAALRELRGIDPPAADRLTDRFVDDLEAALATPALDAVIDAETSGPLHDRLQTVSDVHVTTPVLARLLYGYGPVEACSKPDLLRALREILDSYDLTLDRRSLLSRVLQIAVTTTGADRGSLMLWDERERALRVELAIGIEEELIPKIRVRPGEGIAGRAFAAKRAILLDGKADQDQYQITRERDDIGSAISAPLTYDGSAIGVLNVSHVRDQVVFDSEDLDFVEQLASLDARIIARAEEYHGLVRESDALRTAADVRRMLSETDPLAQRLEAVCRYLAESIPDSVARLHLRDANAATLLLHASSNGIDPLAARERLQPGQGVQGQVASTKRPALLTQRAGASTLCLAVWPLLAGEEPIGVLSLDGSYPGPAPDQLGLRMEAVSSALAAEISGALRSARLQSEAERTAALTELLASVASCRDASQLHDFISSTASCVLQAQDAALRMQDEASGNFRVVSWNGGGQRCPAPLTALEASLSAEAIRTGKVVRVTNLVEHPELSAHAGGVESAMSQPLLHGGRAIGCLSLLGKVADEPLLGNRFDASDQAVLGRLVQHAQVAVANLSERKPDERSDARAGLPARPQLHRRLEEEISRSRERGHSLVLLEVQLDGLAGLLDEGRASLEGHLVDSMRAGLRGFDVLARVARDRDDDSEARARVRIRIGYASFPEDGSDAEQLEARASVPRVEAF